MASKYLCIIYTYLKQESFVLACISLVVTRTTASAEGRRDLPFTAADHQGATEPTTPLQLIVTQPIVSVGGPSFGLLLTFSGFKTRV